MFSAYLNLGILKVFFPEKGRVVYFGGSLSDRSRKSLLLAKTWSFINISVCSDLLLLFFSSFKKFVVTFVLPHMVKGSVL